MCVLGRVFWGRVEVMLVREGLGWGFFRRNIGERCEVCVKVGIREGEVVGW